MKRRVCLNFLRVFLPTVLLLSNTAAFAIVFSKSKNGAQMRLRSQTNYSLNSSRVDFKIYRSNASPEEILETFQSPDLKSVQAQIAGYFVFCSVPKTPIFSLQEAEAQCALGRRRATFSEVHVITLEGLPDVSQGLHSEWHGAMIDLAPGTPHLFLRRANDSLAVDFLTVRNESSEFPNLPQWIQQWEAAGFRPSLRDSSSTTRIWTRGVQILAVRSAGSFSNILIQGKSK